MRGVLIDDDDAVARLRHDVGLVHLRARRAERAVEQIGRGLGDSTRASADGAPMSNAACAASAKPASAVAPCVGKRRAGERASPSRRAAACAIRPERRDGRGAAGGRGALRVARQRLLQGAHDRAAHQPGIAEAHLGLGRMHVHVDLARIDA